MKVQAQQLAAAVVLAFATAAFLASGASATNTVVTSQDAIERYLNNAGRTDAVRPDDRAEVRGPALAALELTPSPSFVSGEDFHWNDAAIGAGATLALVLALITLAGIRQHRSVALR